MVKIFPNMDLKLSREQIRITDSLIVSSKESFQPYYLEFLLPPSSEIYPQVRSLKFLEIFNPSLFNTLNVFLFFWTGQNTQIYFYLSSEPKFFSQLQGNYLFSYQEDCSQDSQELFFYQECLPH